MVFVSHDRYFIDRLATRVIEVEGGSVISYEGNYEDYLRRKEAQAATPSNSIGTTRASANGASQDATSQATNRLHRSVAVYQGTTSVVPNGQTDGALAPETNLSETNFSDRPKDRPRRLNPIKQKQMEDRCAFLEEEVPRIESAIAHTEQQLGVYISAEETQRLSNLADELRTQLAALTSEWEDVMMQLDEQAALS